MELIDKDVLLTEIENRIDRCNTKKRSCPVNTQVEVLCDNKIHAYKEVLSLIDTLEVKEVDLEKYYHEFLQKEWFGNSHVRTISEMMAFTAKHFFELGLKAQLKNELL